MNVVNVVGSGMFGLCNGLLEIDVTYLKLQSLVLVSGFYVS